MGIDYRCNAVFGTHSGALHSQSPRKGGGKRMTSPSYILQSKGGSRPLSFDNLPRAREYRDTAKRRHNIDFTIIKQTIVEETVA